MWGGTRTTGGNMSGESMEKADKLLRQFLSLLVQLPLPKKTNVGFLRSQSHGSQLIVLTQDTLLVVGQTHPGMASTIFIEDEDYDIHEVIDTAKIQLGFADPFVLEFPARLLDQDEEQRLLELEAIAKSHLDSEYRRFLNLSSLVQIDPLFGPAKYSLDPNLVFVLMPFEQELDKIYETFIKPTVQSEAVGLVCKRADDYKRAFEKSPSVE